MKKIIIFLLMPLLLQCSKDNGKSKFYLTKWEDPSIKGRILYERNAEDKLVKTSYYSDGKLYNYIIYKYDKSELQAIENYWITYYRDSGTTALRSLHSLSKNGNDLEYINYLPYKPYTLPSSKAVYLMGDNDEYKRVDVYFYDSSQSVWKYTLYSNFEYYGDTTLVIKQYNASNFLIGVTTLTFDNMKNPMENFDFLPFREDWNNFFPLRFKHNIIRLQAKNTDNKIQYTYNADGYPLTLGSGIFYYESK